MNCVLFSRWPDHPAWIEALRPIISPDARVLMLPYAHDRTADRAEWEAKFAPGGRHYVSAVEALGAWAITPDHIDVAHAFTDDRETVLGKIAAADILLLTGGMPDLAMERMDALGISDAIRAHRGTIMGYSAGALLQMTEFFISPDEDYPSLLHTRGLGLVGTGFHIEVHYEPSDKTDTLLQNIAQESARPIYALSDSGALVLLDDSPAVHLFGMVTVFTPFPDDTHPMPRTFVPA